MPKKIEISYKTIVFTVLFLLFLKVIYTIGDVIVEFFVALLIMAVLNPTVKKLSEHKVPRFISILLVYALLFSMLSFSVAAIVPPLIEQTTAFVNNAPEFMSNLGVSAWVSDQIIQQLVVQVGLLPASVAKITVSFFNNLLGVIAVLVFAFYLLSNREELDEQLGVFLGEKRNKQITAIIDEMEHHLGSWARGQITLMLVVGVFSYIGLLMLGIPFALPLALLAGLLEIVPYVGPIIAAIPAIVIGFGISPILGIATASLTFLVQQLENYVFVPKIMQKSAGVNPIVTLLCLAVGFRLAGFIGLLISVPLFISARVVVASYVNNK